MKGDRKEGFDSAERVDRLSSLKRAAKLLGGLDPLRRR